MELLNKSVIMKLLDGLDLMPLIEKGFIAYSFGEAVIPPIGELTFEDPPGDVHIKYGYIKDEKYYVIKIASGFWNNETYGIPNGQGMMLLFNQKTGEPVALINDEAFLTDIRTAIAGQICAKYFSNEINCIGVIGTGTQARLQVDYLKNITKCRKIAVWGRNNEKAIKYKSDMTAKGFDVFIQKSVHNLCKMSNMIITTTASKIPIIMSEYVQPGTHINAIGADAIGKRELGKGVVKSADLIVVDSVNQCLERGEVSYAILDKEISKDRINELGHILSGQVRGRINKSDITIADLTGVAVQDVQIATAVYEAYLEKKNEV